MADRENQPPFDPPIHPPVDARPATPSPAPEQRRGVTWAAWLVIVGAIVTIIFLRTAGQVQDDPTKNWPIDDPVGLEVMKLQSRYLVGTNEFQPGAIAGAKSTLDVLNSGTVRQRFRYVALISELEDPGEALTVLEDMAVRVAADRRTEMTDTQVEVYGTVESILRGYASQEYDTAWLTAEQREDLQAELGWFAELLLAPADADTAARDEVVEPAQRTFILVLGGFIAGGGVAVLGFIGGVILLILALVGSIRSGVASQLPHGGIYAETFAIWLVCFFAVLTLMPQLAPAGLELVASAVGFFITLLVLGWPVLRGIPWRQVRADIGWTKGRQPLLEPLVGVAGYAIALPMVAVALMVVLFFLAGGLTGSGSGVDPIDYFGPTGGPAHPIIAEAGGASLAMVLQVLLVASVAAPIVEETMFRGVLYAHLRAATGRMATGLSIFISATITSFIFASIHPQGWIAVPLLMSLAYGMTIVREWRGTLIPAMVLHALSNGIVMTLLFLALGD